MAVLVGNTARSLLGLQRTVTCRLLVGKWFQNQLSTSAKLSQTSESSGEKNTRIYEMRTYYVKPKAFGKQMIFFNRPFGFHHQKSSQGSRELIQLEWEIQPLRRSLHHPLPPPHLGMSTSNSFWFQMVYDCNPERDFYFRFRLGKKSLAQVSCNVF